MKKSVRKVSRKPVAPRTDPAMDRCRCGAPRKDHKIANYADGPFVSAAVLICPTAVFFKP